MDGKLKLFFWNFSNFWNNNYIEYESNSDRNKNVSLKEYLDKTKHCVKDIIINLQECDTWKIKSTIAINFISSKDAEKGHVMHAKSNNTNFKCHKVNFRCGS